MNFTPPPVPLHIFDMDHTLIDNDCDVSWKTYLFNKGLLPVTDIFWRDFHYAMYRAGRLDPAAFMEYQLRQIAGLTPPQLEPLLREHFELHVRGRVYAEARELIAALQHQGRQTAILTGTEEPLARGVQEHFRIPHLAGTQVEIAGGKYTGRHVEPYSCNLGKVERGRQLLAQLGLTYADAAYYGDSVTDVPVMDACACAVAVNPADGLRAHALKKNWPILEFSAVQ